MQLIDQLVLEAFQLSCDIASPKQCFNNLKKIYTANQTI